jgi:hypothetical protein
MRMVLEMRNFFELEKRRIQVISQITDSRREVRATLSDARKDVVVAGLRFLAHRFLAKHPFLRTVAIAALALGAKKRTD